MAGEPLTSEAIAMTEKKMDMTLEEIIKMSKTSTTKSNKKQRVPNRNQNFLNNALDKSGKLWRYMDSKSAVRQGVLAQRRSSFQGNQFPVASEAARKAASAPIRNRTFNRSRAMNMNNPRIAASQVQRRPGNGNFASKHQQPRLQQQPQQQQQHHQQAKVIAKHRPQTLDSLFANMKEQRMKVLSQQNNTGRRNGPGQQNNIGRRNGPGQQNNIGRRNGPGQQRPRPPWGRYNN